MTPWTPEDTAQLKALAGTMTLAKLSRTLHHGERMVRLYALQNGISLRSPREWRPEDVAVVRRVAEAGGSHKDAARETGRTPTAVRQLASAERIQFHGSPRTHSTDWSKAQIETLRRIAGAGGSREDVARETGRSVHAVANKSHLLKIKFGRKAYTRRDVPLVAAPAGPAPRERVGLPRAQRHRPIVGTVSWCPACHAPVVDTPQAWAEHRQRVHIEPIRRIA
jgi:hypothetical protein